MIVETFFKIFSACEQAEVDQVMALEQMINDVHQEIISQKDA